MGMPGSLYIYALSPLAVPGADVSSLLSGDGPVNKEAREGQGSQERDNECAGQAGLASSFGFCPYSSPLPGPQLLVCDNKLIFNSWGEEQ